jgi:hypothetical protein
MPMPALTHISVHDDRDAYKDRVKLLHSEAVGLIFETEGAVQMLRALCGD